MSEAIRLIVDGYVSLNDRKSLVELREHRMKLATELRTKQGGPFDFSASIKLFEAELAAIEEGIGRFNSAALM